MEALNASSGFGPPKLVSVDQREITKQYLDIFSLVSAIGCLSVPCQVAPSSAQLSHK